MRGGRLVDASSLILRAFPSPYNRSCAHFVYGIMLAPPAVDLGGESLYYARLT
jgi:hypothetical protein